jgi:predicted LPLAT superfamily acyltransferase
MALNPRSDTAGPRNAGPGWGYGFLRRADRVLPARLFDFLLGLGTWAAVATMPAQRRHSREYLTLILGRPATLREVWRHFFTFMRMFLLRLRLAEGRTHNCRAVSGCEEFMALMASDRPAMLGTFHMGNSDLLGFFFRQFRRRVFMVRLRVGNSPDTDHLTDRFAPWVTFIWVNEAASLLFALKEAAQSGGSIALKCDRIEHAAKLESFEFLGARRLFPFTIYHLALVFRRPVVFCVSVPGAADESLVHGWPIFEPDDESKAANLARARAHFQSVLTKVEVLLRANPFLWFNFTQLNPPAGTSAPSGSPPC